MEWLNDSFRCNSSSNNSFHNRRAQEILYRVLKPGGLRLYSRSLLLSSCLIGTFSELSVLFFLLLLH